MLNKNVKQNKRERGKIFFYVFTKNMTQNKITKRKEMKVKYIKKRGRNERIFPESKRNARMLTKCKLASRRESVPC